MVGGNRVEGEYWSSSPPPHLCHLGGYWPSCKRTKKREVRLLCLGGVEEDTRNKELMWEKSDCYGSGFMLSVVTTKQLFYRILSWKEGPVKTEGAFLRELHLARHYL